MERRAKEKAASPYNLAAGPTVNGVCCVSLRYAGHDRDLWLRRCSSRPSPRLAPGFGLFRECKQ